MAADLKGKLGTNAQTLTCTLASLASSATVGRESTAIDNRTNLFLDVAIQMIIKVQSGTIANDQAVYVYAYGTVNDGTDYTGSASGTDASYTQDAPTTLRLLGLLPMPTSNKTYKSSVWSLASAFGGIVPAFWGIVVRNYTGLALSATEGDHKKLYQGIYGQST